MVVIMKLLPQVVNQLGLIPHWIVDCQLPLHLVQLNCWAGKRWACRTFMSQVDLLHFIENWNFYGLEYEKERDLKRIFCSHQAIEYFQKLLHDLEIVCSYSLDTVLEAVLRFVVDFQKLRPDLVARSYLQVGYQMSSHGHCAWRVHLIVF